MIEESRDKTGGSPENRRPEQRARPATRVLLADADSERRRSLRNLLENTLSNRLLVTAEVSTRDPEAVLRRARSLHPEVVALGLGGVGDVEAVELARELKGLSDAPRVVLFGEWRDGASDLSREGRELFLVFSLAEAHVPDPLIAVEFATALRSRAPESQKKDFE